MGHGSSLQENPAESKETSKTSDDQPRKEAFVETERPSSAKSTKNGKNKEEGKIKQLKDNSDADKNKENVLRAKVMSIASVTIKGPGKLRLKRQKSNSMVTPITAIHSDASAPHSANGSRQSSATKQQPLFSRRKESLVIPNNPEQSQSQSHPRASRSSSATSNRVSGDERPPSGRSTPKLARPRSRRHSRSAVTPADSPTEHRSPERKAEANADTAASNISTQARGKEEGTTVEDF